MHYKSTVELHHYSDKYDRSHIISLVSTPALIPYESTFNLQRVRLRRDQKPFDDLLRSTPTFNEPEACQVFGKYLIVVVAALR